MLESLKSFWIRTTIVLVLWGGVAAIYIPISIQELQGYRFESLILSNGRVSSLQREYLFQRDDLLQPGDWILKVDGEDFDHQRLRERLAKASISDRFEMEVLQGSERNLFEFDLRIYSIRDVILFFVVPLILSLLFLGFVIFSPLQRINFRRNREAVELFSLLCFGFSLHFLLFLPSVSFWMSWAPSVLLPLLSVIMLHLFCVYPKKKGDTKLRWTLLGLAYALVLGFVSWRIFSWHSINKWGTLTELIFFGLCGVGAVISLANTLFNSKDFWARRRARLLSFVFVFCFVAGLGIFISFLWYGPRISLERLLAGALFFPVGFSLIFSKENVFDLERIFRRGAHQVLFLGIAILLAILMGLSWQLWTDQSGTDWLLWTAIAMIVALFARPVGAWADQQLHRLLVGRLRFPDCDRIFERTAKLEDFLRIFCLEARDLLQMSQVSISLFRDPSLPWSKNNEQHWLFEGGELKRTIRLDRSFEYKSSLRRNQIVIGEIGIEGGDSLAFDPKDSMDWKDLCGSFARCAELLVLRDYVEAQQGLLAVGRMQALLAHEMKNPLAVINVCSGLLKEHIKRNSEGEEVLDTIEQEVKRISVGLQKIFDHSGAEEQKQPVSLLKCFAAVSAQARARFPRARIEQEIKEPENFKGFEGDLYLWVQPEALRQSLSNLVINALEAGASLVVLRLRLSAHALSLEVEDNGPGFPVGVDLFRPFVSTKPTGTGLGLSQVQAFVDRHRGQISYKSVAGGGCLFVLQFDSEFVLSEEKR
ncbi:MAG: hypothetical protein EA369_04615 [Bradymonadales bacterium]|nr:MAG: hypothetical protein EA369_04615 [Bradymonadales bacterium]